MAMKASQETVTEVKGGNNMPPLKFEVNSSVAKVAYVAEFNDVKQLWWLAGVLANSAAVGSGLKGSAETTFAAILLGLEIGLSPMQAVQNIMLVKGRFTVWGDSLLALATVHSDFKDITEEFDEQNMVAKCTVKRKGRKDVVRTFSKADATRAGLFQKDGPWHTYTNRMLQIRARTFAIRDMFPDALRGLTSREEMDDVVLTEKIVNPNLKVNAVKSLPKPDTSDATSNFGNYPDTTNLRNSVSRAINDTKKRREENVEAASAIPIKSLEAITEVAANMKFLSEHDHASYDIVTKRLENEGFANPKLLSDENFSNLRIWLAQKVNEIHSKKRADEIKGKLPMLLEKCTTDGKGTKTKPTRSFVLNFLRTKNDEQVIEDLTPGRISEGLEKFNEILTAWKRERPISTAQYKELQGLIQGCELSEEFVMKHPENALCKNYGFKALTELPICLFENMKEVIKTIGMLTPKGMATQ
ncbi:MAG: hypothetical protein KAI83_20225 [Thiomargarita sp.]|nr:hypothetical protein [Thiomargarita sp.]